MVAHFICWYKLVSMSNKYKSENRLFWHRRSRWNEYYKHDYDVLNNIDDFSILSFPIPKLKILCLWPLIFKKYFCHFVLSIHMCSSMHYVKKSVFFKYWKVIFTFFSRDLCTPGVLKINAWLLPSHILFYCLKLCLYIFGVDSLLERSAISKCIWEIRIDDYAKDGGSGEVWLLCRFNHEPLHTWIKANVNKFSILRHTVLKLGIQNLGSYTRLTYECELDTLSNIKVSFAKLHGENFMKLRPHLICHYLCNHLLLSLRILR